jgi:hypothetical protein
MAKWADYCISAVRFNSRHTHIDRVRIYPDDGEKLGTSSEASRPDVISAIRDGKTFVTIFKNTKGTWDKGQSVFIVKIAGDEYIKTVRDNTTVDNLDNLPEF